MKVIKEFTVHDTNIHVQFAKGVSINEFYMQLLNKEASNVNMYKEKRAKTQLVYSTEGLCSLQAYLRSFSLQKEAFLKLLIDILEKVNEIQKNYYVLITTESIFINHEGTLCYVVLPIAKDAYEAIDEDVRSLLSDIVKDVQIESAYETLGLIVQFLKMNNFRMLTLLQELHLQLPQVKHLSFIQKFFFHQEPIPVVTYPLPHAIPDKLIRDAYVEDIIEPENETMLLFESKTKSGYLENEKKCIPIRQSEFHIGRSPDCDYSLNIPSVSKSHALIIQEEDGFYIKDLKSANATYINGKKLKPEKLYCLKDNDSITLGNTTMEFHEG